MHDQILPVLGQFLLTWKFIFSRSHRKLFLLLIQATFYILKALRRCQKGYKILTIILVPDFCPPKSEIARFSIGFCRKVISESACRHQSPVSPT